MNGCTRDCDVAEVAEIRSGVISGLSNEPNSPARARLLGEVGSMT